MRWLLYILLLIFTSCNPATKSDNNHFQTIYAPKYAQSFSIDCDSLQRKIITIRDPYQSDKHFEQRIYLLEKGQPYPEAQIAIQLPVERIACLSSSHIAMLDAIGVADKVIGASGVKFISNQTVRQKAAEIGYDSSLNFELLKALKTDVILLYGLYGEDSATTTKLNQLGIPYIYIGDYIEPLPLGKAEWVVALAALCSLQERGIEYFNALESRYNSLKKSVEHLSYTPKVMLNTPYRDTWFMPPISSYAVQLIADAGGEYIYPQNTSSQSVPISLEQALILASSADIWLNVGQIQTIEELKKSNPKFASTPAVMQNKVYNNTKRSTASGGSDFWESGAVNPDIVLRDMIQMLHHNAPTDSLYYYKRLE